MNVLFVSSARNWGGVKTWMLELADFLSQRGHQTAIVCRKGELLEPECLKRGVICHPIQFGMDFSPATIRTFWQLFSRQQTDIVITNIAKDFRTAGIAAKIKGIPHVNRLGAVGDLKMTFKTRMLYSFCVDHIFVPSQSLFDFFAKHAFLRRKLQMFHNAITVPERRDAQNAVTKFAIVAKLSQLKQIDRVIRAFSHIQELPWELHIGGFGDELPTLQQLVRSLKLEPRISFSEKKVDAYKFLQDKDVGILYSKQEAFGIAIIEYMAMSCAVIASNVGGIPEIITHGIDGLLVNPHDLDELERAIRFLIAHPQRMRELAQQGYSRVQQYFSRDIIFPHIEAELQQFIQK